ncbi:hypothetical protein [Streptomyces peucetius]|nr:hypothetical protein CGZ69_35560 [Streptomyces peucetius subsp. caesius ATCC 27952]
MRDELLGPEFARIARARTSLEDACAGVVEMAQDVDDCTPMGTELPAAVAALESSECVDEDDAGALLKAVGSRRRWSAPDNEVAEMTG